MLSDSSHCPCIDHYTHLICPYVDYQTHFICVCIDYRVHLICPRIECESHLICLFIDCSTHLIVSRMLVYLIVSELKYFYLRVVVDPFTSLSYFQTSNHTCLIINNLRIYI